LAYAPFFDFHVGTALLTGEGEIVSGWNVENSF
jgi:cytidine deaminase